MGLYNRRKRGHDYYGPFIYHIILKKRALAPDFSKIIGDAAIAPGNPGCARPDYSKLGFAILNALLEFESRFKEFRKHQYSIMPDHVHIILQKLNRTGTHLENYMKVLKDMVADKYLKESGILLKAEDIFEERFTDKHLYKGINLGDWIKYVRDNPHRRAMIIQRPYFFQKKRNLKIGEVSYEAYGNLFLFRNPDKFAVRIRRHYNAEQINTYSKLAIDLARKGTIMVSPFISEHEKNIKEMALEAGGKLIKIQHESFGERFKPSGRDFMLCSEGRLLIISLKMPKSTPLSYEIATRMNELAELIGRTCR